MKNDLITKYNYSQQPIQHLYSLLCQQSSFRNLSRRRTSGTTVTASVSPRIQHLFETGATMFGSVAYLRGGCFRELWFGLRVRLVPNLGLIKISFSASQNVLKLILKSPRFIPLGANLTQFGSPNLTSLMNLPRL